MKKIKILNLDNYVGTQNVINKHNCLIPVERNKNNYDANAIICRLGEVLDSKYLAKFKNLKYIATITTGIDHIDLEYCKKNKIKLISLRDEGKFLKKIKSTPEFTWGLIIAINRHLCEAVEHVRLRNGWRDEAFFGNQLSGKTIGIIGYGRIGRQLSKYALAFDMKVLVNDIKEVVNKNKKIQVTTKEKICKDADVIVISASVPSNPISIINARHFRLMKKNTILINTARGSLVDEEQLLNALKSSNISAAALDVLDGEVKSSGPMASKLIDYSKKNTNLIITPHLGGSTYEAMNMTADFIIDNLVKEIRRDEKNN